MAKTTTDDWDGPWKDSILGLLPCFLRLFFPKVYADIDWSRGFESLDKEFQKLAPDAGTGVRTVDLLIKVWRRNGEEQWVLIHVEVQAQRIVGLPKRIQVYNGRATDRYGMPVVSFVVLADDEPAWRPGPYVFDLWGFRSECSFPTVKLRDFADRVAELEADDNPFAVVVLAHLKARETANDRSRRRKWKERLLKGLYNRGWDRKDIRQLIRSIDWFLKLPRKDDLLVLKAIKVDEKEKNMPYITSFEQIAMEKGRAEGRAEGLTKGRASGLVDGIALALRAKFGEAGQRLISAVKQIKDTERLERMIPALESAATVEEARQAILDKPHERPKRQRRQ